MRKETDIEKRREKEERQNGERK
jgi:hypothetical protein